MFMSDMILMRLTSAGPTFEGRLVMSESAPSIRKRTRMWSSVGSMWTSEARSRRACVTSLFTSWMIGASSPLGSAVAAPAARAAATTSARAKALTCASTSASAGYAALSAAVTSTAGPTWRFTSATGSDSRSSYRSGSSGSMTATVSALPSRSSGRTPTRRASIA